MGVIGLTPMTLHWIKAKIHEKREKERPRIIFKERHAKQGFERFPSARRKLTKARASDNLAHSTIWLRSN
jgi:hypothetical protein